MIGRRRPIRIGLSARIFHPELGGAGIRSRTLQVLEQSVAQWAMSRDVLVLMLQGGADVSPQAYGEEPLRPEWNGDAVRDAYELELVHEFMEARKPILGICRGMQLINVALGGSLFQDLPTQFPTASGHETPAYDRNIHTVKFIAGGKFADWFGGRTEAKVVSIHHQAINRPGRGVVVEAEGADGVVEAIRWDGRSFVCGVQWHPEFHAQFADEDLLDCAPLLEAFLAAAR